MSVDNSHASTLQPDHVAMAVPLRAEFGSTVRTVAAALGADLGFSIDEIDDIRLALSEVFAAMAVPAAADDRAQIVYLMTPGSIRIEIRTDRGSIESITFDDLALAILRSVTDDFVVAGESIVLVKNVAETADAAMVR